MVKLLFLVLSGFATVLLVKMASIFAHAAEKILVNVILSNF